jgi:hypothetical protein
VQDAVRLALNGTLEVDHIGSDRTAQAEKLIRENAVQANELTLKFIAKPENRTWLEDIYVGNVVRLTKEKDKAGAIRVLEKFSTLLDAVASEEKLNAPGKSSTAEQKERHENRLQRLSAAREQAARLIEAIAK